MVDFLVIKCYHDITIVKKDGETMKLWGGRFTKETNQLVHNFNALLSFDQKFYKQDIKWQISTNIHKKVLH